MKQALRIFFILLAITTLPVPTLATTINVVYSDPPGVGFNDHTPVTPIPGNAGTTLGTQRRIAHEFAVKLFERVLWIPDNRPISSSIDFFSARDSVLSSSDTQQYLLQTDDVAPGLFPGYEYPYTLIAARTSLSLPTRGVITNIKYNANYNFHLATTEPTHARSMIPSVLHEYLHAAGISPGYSTGSTSIFERYLNPLRGASGQSVTVPRRFVGQATVAAAVQILTAGHDNGEVVLSLFNDEIHLSDGVQPSSIMAPGGARTLALGIVAYMLSDLGWGPVSDSAVALTEVDDDSVLRTVTQVAGSPEANLLVTIRYPTRLTVGNILASPATCNEPAAGMLQCRFIGYPGGRTDIQVDFTGPADTYQIEADIDHQGAHIDPQPGNNFAVGNFSISPCNADRWRPRKKGICKKVLFTQTNGCGDTREKRGKWNPAPEGWEELIATTCNTDSAKKKNDCKIKWSAPGMLDPGPWRPDPSTVRLGEEFTQTNNCPEKTKPAIGTNPCNDWTPSAVGVCSNVWVDQSNSCGDNRIVRGTKNPGPWLPSAAGVCSTDTVDQTNQCGQSETVQGLLDPGSWRPDPSTVRLGEEFTQTNNCPEKTNPAIGTNPCNDWTPSAVGVCSNVWVDQSNSCGDKQKVPGTKNPGPWLPSAAGVCSTDTVDQTNQCGQSETVPGLLDPGSWRPDPSTVRLGEEFTQTNNCPEKTKPAIGTNPCNEDGKCPRVAMIRVAKIRWRKSGWLMSGWQMS